MTVRDALTGERALRRMLILTVSIGLLGVVVFMGVRFYEGIRLQHVVGVNEERLVALEALERKHHDNQEARLALIESFLFGEVTSELESMNALHKQDAKADTDIRSRDAWIQRRNAEIVERLMRLEQWRLTVRP